MTGRLVALLDDQTQYSTGIWHRGSGSMKDVFSLNWRKPGGGEVQAVMKPVETRYLGELQRDARAACHERMTGMVPEQYGLHENVEVCTQHPGMLGRRQPDYTGSLQPEADHGDDVTVAFHKLLDDGQDRGRLVAPLDDQTQYSTGIWHRSSGSMKDVFSLNWRKPGGGEVRAVMKLVETRYLGELQRDARAACRERMTGMVPEQYGLHENVEVCTQHPGMLGMRQPGYTGSLQSEADHGDDVTVAFHKLLDDGQDCVRRALDLWRGAVEFIMEWQFREGGRREAWRYHFLLDVHPKNMCALAWISDIYL